MKLEYSHRCVFLFVCKRFLPCLAAWGLSSDNLDASFCMCHGQYQYVLPINSGKAGNLVLRFYHLSYCIQISRPFISYSHVRDIAQKRTDIFDFMIKVVFINVIKLHVYHTK